MMDSNQNNVNEVLEMYLKQQEEKIAELSRQLMMVSTKYKLLEKRNAELQEAILKYDVEEAKHSNRVNGFKHTTKSIRISDQKEKAAAERLRALAAEKIPTLPDLGEKTKDGGVF